MKRPKNWPHNATLGKGYDLLQGEGKRVWRDCLAASSALRLSEATASNVELIGHAEGRRHYHFAFARLGQATFREALVGAYGQCAVSREHSEPALDAAHIEPYSDGGPSTITNGLLLRADIHRLYDRHYVSVTPDYEFWVSDRLRDEFDNGVVYYEMAEAQRRVVLPNDKRLWPDRDRLAAHWEAARAG